MKHKDIYSRLVPVVSSIPYTCITEKITFASSMGINSKVYETFAISQKKKHRHCCVGRAFLLRSKPTFISEFSLFVAFVTSVIRLYPRSLVKRAFNATLISQRPSLAGSADGGGSPRATRSFPNNSVLPSTKRVWPTGVRMTASLFIISIYRQFRDTYPS